MKSKPSLAVIFVTVFIDLMGFGILIPILPTFASKELGVSDFGIGIIVASFSFMQFLFNPILGKLSDKYGRRPFIVGSLLLTSSSYIIFSYANSFFLLLLSRMLGGIGGSNISVAQAYIADITPSDERSKGMGLIGAAFGLGFVFGPMIGGFLSEISYAFAGFASAGFSFMAFLFSVFFLPESNPRREQIGKINFQIFDFATAVKTLKKPVLGILVILYFIIVFSMANIYGTFALLGYKEYNLTDREIGTLFGLIGIISALVQGVLIKYSTKYISDKNLILTGTFLTMIGLGLLPYGINFIGLLIISAIFALGTATLQPVILGMVSKYTPEKEQGLVLGFNQSFSAVARILGPLWGGFAFEFLGYEFPFLTGAFFTFVTLFITYFLLKEN